MKPILEQNVTDQVTDRIRAAIYDGHLSPGTRLVERRLSAELQVSHIPIREALTRLSKEGIVERLPRRGCRVATLSETDLEQISSLREVLEHFVVVRAQARLTETSEAQLKKIVDDMLAAARRHDVKRVVELDSSFHELLWRCSEHPLLVDLVSQLRGRISGFVRAATLALEPEALEQHARTHEELLDAITSGKPDRARAAMSTHIAVAADRIHRSLAAAESAEAAA